MVIMNELRSTTYKEDKIIGFSMNLQDSKRPIEIIARHTMIGRIFYLTVSVSTITFLLRIRIGTCIIDNQE